VVVFIYTKSFGEKGKNIVGLALLSFLILGIEKKMFLRLKFLCIIDRVTRNGSRIISYCFFLNEFKLTVAVVDISSLKLIQKHSYDLRSISYFCSFS